jgi:hypothetical protein
VRDAGFQRQVKSSSFQIIRGLPHKTPFGVILTEFLVTGLRENGTVPNQTGSHHGIGSGVAEPLGGRLKSSF